ncbi:gei-17 [Pristionchus pacificus]|uniref:Gei-17 n=1 Tax=Pristionchus pacificus TaxID=54126 RepID=A0A8R1U6M4_PRIPA|nr:gei-17 [Pristionchus pacificus]
MLPIGQNRPTSETQLYENKLSQFKVNDLQSLLQAFKVQKVGKKSELYTRCVEMLRTPNMTKAVIEKIKELETRCNRPSPYPLPTIAPMYNNQQQHNIYQQQRGYAGYGGAMPGLMGGGMSLQQNMNNLMVSRASERTKPVLQSVNLNQTSNINPRPARHLTAMPLPFYDPIHTLLEPQELPASVNLNCKLQAQVNLQFVLSAEHHMKLSVNEKDFPRTEVQLRFFNTTGDILNIEQPDDFPLNCNVRINEASVNLPNVIPTNKPNVEPKRPSRPVNITQYVINQPREKQHRMRVDWTADKRQWAVAIYLVTRVNSDILRKRVVASPSFELPYETTEATIRKRLGGDDEDVCMDTLKISLLCPLMKTRMTIAARSRDCTHLQCFDLDSYLMLNEKKPAWKCGVCNSSAPYHKLIIDKYFMKMLKDLGPAVTDVELLKDGNYRVISEDDAFDISDDDDCGSSKPKAAQQPKQEPASGSRPSSLVGAAPATGAKKMDVDDGIITISDDEDEDQDLRNAIQASMPGTASEQLQRTPVKASPPSDDSIIILDDTPPRPEAESRLASGSSASSGVGGGASSSSWRPVASSSAAVCSSSNAAPAAAAATTTTTYAQQQQQPRNLADALSQATGIRPSGVIPSQLQLNGGGGAAPLSAAVMAANQPIYNWGAPQSAPPMMQQQQPWQYAMQQQMQQNGYANYGYGAPGMAPFDPRQMWAPPNGPPNFAPAPNSTVIRRHDDPR